MESILANPTIHLIFKGLFAAFFIYAGISHFRNPKFFLKITPKWVPEPEKVNLFVGAVEVVLGVALMVPVLQSYAAWGIIALLIAVFPANMYHHQKAREKGKYVWQTMLRLPFQGLFIWWAWMYT